MDRDVLTAVIGRTVPESCRQDAVMDNYRRVYRSGAWYPILIPEPGASVLSLRW